MLGELKVGDRVIDAVGDHGTVRYVHGVGVHVWVDWDDGPFNGRPRGSDWGTNCMAISPVREESVPVHDPTLLEAWLES